MTLTNLSQKLLYKHVAEHHYEEKGNCYGAGIAHLVAHGTVVVKVGQDRVSRIVYGREARKLNGYA